MIQYLRNAVSVPFALVSFVFAYIAAIIAGVNLDDIDSNGV
jgi:hypothetical protein